MIKEYTNGIYGVNLITSLAIFYLIILSNFMLQLFTCYQQHIINNNKTIQYFLGFFLFYFLVSIFSDTGDMQFTPPIQKLILTIGYYFFFIITTRLDTYVMLLVLFLIFSIYFIEINKEYFLNTKEKITNKKNLEFYENHDYWITLDSPFYIRLFRFNKDQVIYLDIIEKYIYFVIWILIIIGMIAYAGEIKYQMGPNNKKFTWSNVFNDSQICDLKNRRPFIANLKMGLSVKL
jgi:hypothetical protein